MAYSSNAVAKTICGAAPRSARSTSNPSMPGICTSRKTRSGRCSSINRTASTPSCASPTSSTPPTRERNARSRSRASFSSSTTSVRMPPAVTRRLRRANLSEVGRSRGLLHREPQPHDGAASRAALDLGQVIRPVQALEARSQVAQPDAARIDLREHRLRHAEPVVADRQREELAVHVRVDRHRADAALARQAVLDGVLDQRLQDEVRDELAKAAGVDVGLHAQALVEAGALDVEVRTRHLEFLGQRYELLLGSMEDVAEDLGEALDAGLRLVGVGVDQLGDRVEAVEEEVRVDLGPQRRQLRGGGELAELPLAGLQLLHVAPDEVVGDEAHQSDRDDGWKGVGSSDPPAPGGGGREGGG